jgi:hypothetical protein
MRLVVITDDNTSIISPVSTQPQSGCAELTNYSVYSYQFKYVLVTGHRVFKDHSAKRVKAMKIFR